MVGLTSLEVYISNFVLTEEMKKLELFTDLLEAFSFR